MKAQTAIRGDRLTPPKANVQCEWCEEGATDSLPLMCKVKGKRGARSPSGMRVYFCKSHREQAERLVKEPIR